MDTGKVVRELTGTVVGWRAWTVRETAAGLRLGSVLHELDWAPGDPAVAECAVEGGVHPVPGPRCLCGFHAVRDPVDALSYLIGRDDANTVCRVLGEVALWGHVLETESGWRASHALPLRLYVRDQELVPALSAYGVAISCDPCASRSSRTCTGTPLLSVRRSPTSSAKTST
jgi:hypothetical protein